jgi:hypothetical protein
MIFFQDEIDLEQWAFETLKNSTEFNSLATSLFDENLNYYSSTPIDGEDMEKLPSVTTFQTGDGADASGEFVETWVLPIAIRVAPNYVPEDYSGVKFWVAPQKLKKLAKKAVNVLSKSAEECGVSSLDIVAIDAEIMISEIGEVTEDIQASISIAFGRLNSIRN